jgi:ribulose-phosphate 3-epimerase
MPAHLIAPSMLAADFGRLADEVALMNRSQADWLHCDIMDGLFVPNLSFGIPVLEAIHRHSKLPLDVHLMIERPERYLEVFRDAGAAVLTVHYEACTHLDRTLHAIRALGMLAGVALNPSTPVDVLRDTLYCTDLVCLMSVNPGYGGQKFIENTFMKVRRLRQLMAEVGHSAHIEIDGGVNQQNAPLLLAAGADVLVAGSFVFTAADPIATIQALKDTQVPAQQA